MQVLRRRKRHEPVQDRREGDDEPGKGPGHTDIKQLALTRDRFADANDGSERTNRKDGKRNVVRQ